MRSAPAECGFRITPRAQHFAFPPFLNRNVETALQFPVNRRKRNRHIKRNAMPLRQNSLGVGADLVATSPVRPRVRSLPTMTKSISPRCIKWPAALSAMMWCGNFLLRQFPGGQRRALGTRPGFIAKDMKFFALRLRGIHRRGGGANIHKRQPARVAMGQHVRARPNQSGPVPSDGFTMTNIVIGRFLRRRQRERLLFRHGTPGLHGCATPTMAFAGSTAVGRASFRV